MHYTSLLRNEVRPLPKSPTHFLLIEVLNRDLSIKRITIYFNPSDEWENPVPVHLRRDKDIGLFIARNITFLGRDEKAVSWECYIIEIVTQTIISRFHGGAKENPKYPL